MSVQVTKRLFILSLSLFMLALVACTPPTSPPATLQAVAAESDQLALIELENIEILQQRPLGGNEIMLYTWQNELGATCLATSNLSIINGQWQIRDTISTDCYRPSEAEFVAAYTGNSHVDVRFGQPRHTTVYGISQLGSAVQIVWADGQVTHTPLKNGSFLETRSGKWKVERIELLDQQNNLLMVEDWPTAEQFSN